MAGKYAIVFGGTRGIGAACVEALARDGFDVMYTYTSAVPEPAPGGGSSRVAAQQCDVREKEQVDQVFAAAAAEFGGPPQCVVASAGINVLPGPLAEFPADRFRALVETNIVGAFNMLGSAAKGVADGGTIIGITTSMVRLAVPGVGPYTASKAAVESLLRSMQKELAGRGVRVNGVAPGPVDTDLFRSGKDEAAVARSAGLSVFNRVGLPEEVAEVVAFLASERASWVAGQIVQPNGGMV